eukprot:TRINITY_DN1823_c0_g1_i8.p1 TRINITY_DN1823_c0_g1~~TRINITY_DN1823_c0_g1_i8.p1  ORF type:complete len:898 (-),score=319.97 TRINITY_DN1823_c0_g1_i8:163-2823(-)
MAEIAQAVTDDLNEAFARVAAYREKLHEKVRAGEMENEDMQRELHRYETVELDPEHAEQRATHHLKGAHEQHIDALRREQRQTVRDYFKMVYPDETFEGREWQERFDELASLRRASATENPEDEDQKYGDVSSGSTPEATLREATTELERKRAEEEREFAAKIAQIKADELAMKEAKQAQMQREMEEFEQRLRNQQVQYEDELDRKFKLYQEEDERKREEKVRKQLAESASYGADAKDRIIQQAQEEANAADQAMQAELEAQKQKLRDRLAKDQERLRLAERRRKEEELKRELVIQQEKKKLEMLQLEQERKKRQARLLEKTSIIFEMFGRKTQRVRSLVDKAIRKFKRLQQRAFLKRPLPIIIPELNGHDIDYKALARQALDAMEAKYHGNTDSNEEKVNVDMTPAAPAAPAAPAVSSAVAPVANNAPSRPLVGLSDLGRVDARQTAMANNQAQAGVPVLGKLSQIETMLQKLLVAEGVDEHASSETVPGEYVDPKDEVFVCEGKEPRIVDPSELNARKFVIYRFGVFLLDLIHSSWHDHSKPITLLLAHTLPPHSLTHNAFRNSVHYQPATRTLFVRHERAEDVGEFTLILMHALAHIHCEVWDDRHPLYLREFYRVTRVVGTHLFFSRAQRAFKGGVAQPGEPVVTELEYLFNMASSVSSRDDLVSDYINLAHTSQQGLDDYFSTHQLSTRLSRFKAFLHSWNLRQKLLDSERKYDLVSLDPTREEKERNEHLTTEGLLLEQKEREQEANERKEVMSGNANSSSSSSASSSSQSRSENENGSSSGVGSEREKARLVHGQVSELESALDKLHAELAELVEAIYQGSMAVVRLEMETNPQDVMAMRRVRKVKSNLNELNARKEIVMKRISDTERRLLNKVKEIGI